MSSTSRLSMAELNAAALEHFVYMPVSKTMIAFLAQAAQEVIQCDPSMMPPPPRQPQQQQLPTPPRTPSPRAVRTDDSSLPTLEEFITQLVVTSNVQVPTLMSTLVYLTRLKARLQPMAKGLRCTTHRIFLASLILAAKYLNDSSPKNKHWASYSVIQNDAYSFGFSRTEVNLMEKQLLLLLDWDLRITEENLYQELEYFLAPIRTEIEAKYARRQQRREEERRRKEEEEAMWAAAAAASYPTPPSSRGSSRTRHQKNPSDTIRMVHDPSTPPGLAYSSSASSASSYASSVSSREYSRSNTPSSDLENAYVYNDRELYESPVEIVMDPPKTAATGYRKEGKQLLPYEISVDELRELQDGGNKAKKPRIGRGMLGRMFGTGVMVR